MTHVKTFTSLATIAFGAALTLVACAKKDEPVQPATPGGQYPQGQYPQQNGQYPQQPGQYPQQGGQYPQQTGQYPQQAGQYPQQGGQVPPTQPATGQPAAGQPAAGGTMAVPAAFATPCQNDSVCGIYRCNVQYGKCAVPCQSEVDCIQGLSCFNGLCVPKMGQ
ncbi:MAG: hypothetical protein U0169_25455 [Polyangiaceae bacterium]